MKQRTDEWLSARLGKLTASRMADVLAKTKTGPSASRENYAMEIALERLTGVRQHSSFTSPSIQWGEEQEPAARCAYEVRTGCFVDAVGFVPHPSLPMAGASPDGLVGDDGLIEIKCPDSKTHFAYLKSGKPPAKYQSQMLFQLACTGRQWCDFVSYDPRMPDGLQFFLVRFEPAAQDREMIDAEAATFLTEVSALVEQMELLRQQT